MRYVSNYELLYKHKTPFNHKKEKRKSVNDRYLEHSYFKLDLFSILSDEAWMISYFYLPFNSFYFELYVLISQSKFSGIICIGMVHNIIFTFLVYLLKSPIVNKWNNPTTTSSHATLMTSKQTMAFCNLIGRRRCSAVSTRVDH